MSNTPSDKPQSAAALREARAQHRRALLETRLSLISVGAFLFVFAAIAIFLLVFPRSTKSQIENRNLAEFPTFSLESYFPAISPPASRRFTTTRCRTTTASRT